MKSELSFASEIAKKRLLISSQANSAQLTPEQIYQIKKEIQNILSRHLDISSDKYEVKIILKEDKKRD